MKNTGRFSKAYGTVDVFEIRYTKKNGTARKYYVQADKNPDNTISMIEVLGHRVEDVVLTTVSRFELIEQKI